MTILRKAAAAVFKLSKVPLPKVRAVGYVVFGWLSFRTSHPTGNLQRGIGERLKTPLFQHISG